MSSGEDWEELANAVTSNNPATLTSLDAVNERGGNDAVNERGGKGGVSSTPEKRRVYLIEHVDPECHC